MYLDDFRTYCLAKYGVTEELPFDENTLVFKVMGKIFAITDIASFDSVSLKCNPEEAVSLRERYIAVQPGFHMNKKHWNTIEVHSDMPREEIFYWVDVSYQLVVAGLPKALRAEVQAHQH
jgi:predicted DNA-binding protein (MmcQ/YjbR family)